MRPGLFLSALVCGALGFFAAGHAAAGEGHPTEEDEDLPALPSTSPEEPPRGAQDGAVAGATLGAAQGILQTATTLTPSTTARVKYANLDRPTCEAELVRRKIPFERVGEARGVLAPVRLTGPLSGVTYRSMLPEKQRRTSPYEIYDCRLVLALDDYARILARHDIVEVVHFSVYRPPPAKMTGLGRRHAGGLAIDAGLFKTRSGETISVEKDFHGRIGAKTCGVPTSGLPEKAKTLRALACEPADQQLFNVVLTPDYNWPHRNHFHLEVTAGVRWQFVR